MKRKLISIVAAAAALPVSAMAADGPTATVYGNVNLSIDTFNDYNYGGSSSTDLGFRPRLTANASYFGIKGAEEISADYSAIFQLESGVGVDINGGAVTSRNSAVGLKGPFGQVMLGQWDTPVKVLFNYAEPFYAAGVANGGNLLDSPGLGVQTTTQASGGGTSSSADLAFNRRQGDTIQYWNNWGAFQLRAMYGFGGSGTVLPMRDMYSGSLVFDDFGLTLGVAYEVHNNFRTGTTAFANTGGGVIPLAGQGYDNTKDTDLKATAGYKFGDTQIAGVFSLLNYNNNNSTASTSSNYSRPAYGGVIMHKLGNFTPKFMLTLAADGSCTHADASTCTTTGLGATQGVIGTTYAYSKRTEAYIFASRLSNGSSGTYTYATNTGTAAMQTLPNTNSDVISIGVRHVF